MKASLQEFVCKWFYFFTNIIMSLAITMDMFLEELSEQRENCRYFVHTQYGHYKYYIADFNQLEARYGRIGAASQRCSYSKGELEKKIREKLAKWYKEITGDTDAMSKYIK